MARWLETSSRVAAHCATSPGVRLKTLAMPAAIWMRDVLHASAVSMMKSSRPHDSPTHTES